MRASLPEVAFDYVIVAGEPESVASKKIFADKLGVPVEQLIFDFELCNGTFDMNLSLLRKIYGA
ncbi:MAG: hypothetical protein SR1Q7_12660 [Quinella sp. 1Q7]|nr:hypothetical protein [Quinella sp. 1Q7]